MRHVSREDGGPRKSAVAMEQPTTTNSTFTKRTLTSPAEMTAVPLLQGLLHRHRDELAKEREVVRALRRDRAAEIKAVREEEAVKCRKLLSDLKSRLERDHEDALQRQKDSITKTMNSEMLRALKAKDAEIRRQLTEAREREELLKLQAREAVRAGRDAAGSQRSGTNSVTVHELQQEVTALRLRNKQMEERLQMAMQADRQKVYDLRSQQAEHECQLAQLRKTWQQERHKLLEEIRSKDRTVQQLEQQRNMQEGRVQEHERRRLERQDGRRHHECDCARVLVQRLDVRQANMKKAVEMEMVADPNGHVAALETLRTELQERERIIAELQLAARFQDSDRKPDQLKNRHRKEQIRRCYRNFMELEPVAELEEDSGAGEDSPTSSSSPSLSPQPYTADLWAELPDTQYHDTLYSCLLKEHLELQREYQFLQNRLTRVLAEPNRIRLKLEHELAAAEARNRKLKGRLAEQEDGAVVLSEKMAQLQAETHDLREQNELLEFRILELEECHDNLSVKSHGPDTRDVWTDTDSDDISDSGVQSLPSSDGDVGTEDTQMEILNEELKFRLQELIKATSNTAERNCLQQVLALLENCECRVQEDNPAAGRALRNSSECNRIIATVLPFTDESVDKNKNTDDGEGDEIKRQLKNSECLQESGIFEETEYCCQGTQTDDFNFERLIGEMKLPFEAGVVGELSAEIQRLNQFRERVEEAGHCCGNKQLLRVGDDLPSHRKELDYCRERLQLLEDKVRIYESSGDHQARLLTERLQKEIRLSAQVKELSAKVQHLIAENRCLEEEKCELEETENDTRLRCQKLELKMVTLSERKADLETQLQQERRTTGRLRSCLSKSERKDEESKRQCSYLEVMLNKYEQRNYDLEEREVDLKHRLEMLENSIPALIIWNMWRILENTRIPSADAMSRCLVKVASGDHHGDEGVTTSTASEPSVTMCLPCPPRAVSSGFQDIEQERPRIKTGLTDSEEVRRPTEEQLRFKLQDLEAKVSLLNAKIQSCEESEDKYKKRVAELEDELRDIMRSPRVESSEACDDAVETTSDTEFRQNQMNDVQSARCTNFECMRKVQELTQCETDMKKRIVELERKERAYMETLQKADELWSDMETSYKRRISDAEDNEAVLRETLRKLQESETKLRQAFRQDEENEMMFEKIQSMEENEKMFAERIRVLEGEKHDLTEEISHLRDTLQSQQTELEKTKELVARPLQEELVKERRLSKSLQFEMNTLERDSQNRSRDQQAQINGLKVQVSKMSRDLVDLECTNGELKEEVETLEAKVSELKGVIEEQKQVEEKLVIEMSQTILQKEQEVEDMKRELRFSKTPNAHDELREVDSSRNAVGTDSAQQPAGLEQADGQRNQAGKDLSKIPATNVALSENTTQAPGAAKQVTQQPSAALTTREYECSCGVKQPPPVSTLSQKPVLRRWLYSQTLQQKECSHWRHC